MGGLSRDNNNNSSMIENDEKQSLTNRTSINQNLGSQNDQILLDDFYADLTAAISYGENKSRKTRHQFQKSSSLIANLSLENFVDQNEKQKTKTKQHGGKKSSKNSNNLLNRTRSSMAGDDAAAKRLSFLSDQSTLVFLCFSTGNDIIVRLFQPCRALD